MEEQQMKKKRKKKSPPTLDVQVSGAGNLSERVGRVHLDHPGIFRSNADQPQRVRLMVDVVRNDTPLTRR